MHQDKIGLNGLMAKGLGLGFRAACTGLGEENLLGRP